MVGRAGGEDVQGLPAEEGVVEGAVGELHAVAEGRDVVRVVLRVQRRRVVKNRVAAANAGLPVPERIPGEADAGREVVVVGVGDDLAELALAAVSRRLCVAVIEQAGQRILIDLRPDAGAVRGQVEGLVSIELVLEELVRLVPQAEVQRKAGPHAPGVAEIPAGLRASALLQFPAVLCEERKGTQQEVGAVEAILVPKPGGMSVELELTGTVKECVVVKALANHVHAPHQAVAAL